MNHTSFDPHPHPDWLLDEAPPEAARAEELRQHLLGCPDCAALSAAWETVREEIATLPPAAPAPGFTQRWQARLAEKKAAQQARLRRVTVGLNVLLLGGGLAAWFLPRLLTFSPAESAYLALASLASVLMRLQQLRYLFLNTAGGLPTAVPLVLWVLGACGLAVLGLAWAATLWKFIVPKGMKV